MIRLSHGEQEQLREWRREVVLNDHVVASEWISSVQEIVAKWPALETLDKTSSFFEVLDLYTGDGQKAGARSWRGLAHWLWLRHGSVHGMLFTENRLAILQQRSDSVSDSPGDLDMTFSGHMGTLEVQAADAAATPQGMESEARDETGLLLDLTSPHVAASEDLEPICRYDYVEPPRPKEEFYNAEIRHVFAIRVTPAGLGALQPIDGEVAGFLVVPLEEAWSLLRNHRSANALKTSGPLAIYHAMREWGWM